MVIIPDIHGREFWQDVVKGREEEEIIFLGDYLDPYRYEEQFSKKTDEEIHKGVIDNFKKIIEFKKSHPKNVILLLGNHDLHYTCIDKAGRYDYLNAGEISNLFTNNWGLFQMAYEKTIGRKRFIFSHAGISKDWLTSHGLTLKGWTEKNIVDWVNNAYLTKNGRFFASLNDVSNYRGGYNWFGSMVWADFQEYIGEEDGLIGDYQVFGHTQLKDNPFVWSKFADLDCRRAFILNEDGKITEIDGKIIEKTKKPKEDEEDNTTL